MVSKGFLQAIKNLKKPSDLLVTPAVQGFLLEHPEGARFDGGTSALIDEILAAWTENNNRSGRFGASARGTCLRRQIFAFLGLPHTQYTDVILNNLFNDGKWRHLKWQIMGIESGAFTHVEHVYASKKWRVSGRMDGLNSHQSFGVEIKGSRRMGDVLQNGVPHPHILQMHTMMLATGWDTFSYIIEDKASQDWREFVVRRDDQVMAEVTQELEALNEHVEYQQLPFILPECQARQGAYRGCPYSGRCLSIPDVWPEDGHWPEHE